MSYLASGYLTIVTEPMRVSPSNQYQSVKREISSQIKLASPKEQVSCGCTSFVYINCASTVENATSPPDAALLHDSETSSESSTSDSGKESVADDIVHEPEKKRCIKSSKKKPLADCFIPTVQDNTVDLSIESPSSTAGFAKTRKVQWTDACGKELFEIKEFQLSEGDLSDDDFGHGGDKCNCLIL